MLASVRVGTVNSPRPFFKRGAYTESNNAPVRKQGLATRDYSNNLRRGKFLGYACDKHEDNISRFISMHVREVRHSVKFNEIKLEIEKNHLHKEKSQTRAEIKYQSTTGQIIRTIS